MKTIHALIFLTVGLFMAHRVQAHALWIETSPSGKSGKAQEVRIYYGEPSEGVLENINDWWSDVREFDLMLHLPDGSHQQLTTTAKDNHFVATFTPEAEGVYTLRIVQPVAETFEGHKYQFNSAALVRVGKVEAAAIGAEEELRVFTGAVDTKTLGKPVEAVVRLDGKPLKELEVTVFSPNGWSKTFHTDENGAISFVPDRRGHYLIEAAYSTDVKEAAYQHLHRIATWSLSFN
ncbi:DUF4198 domain-containing protein [Parapedobacter sp. DT-150]|uniref:DUF4198 domain-containing protein n=1 Tax=Parapedobacter sp. DT-150 TaxID=3396162 RepID=UPI003F1B8EE2